MSRDLEYIADIVEAARLAIEYVSGMTIEVFLLDTQCQDAVIRRLEIIGEAARRVSDTTRAAQPHVPWPKLVAMRNIMIHEYDDVDLEIVWQSVTAELPPLAKVLEAALRLER